jgi:serine O-acetyltransferase
MGIIIHPDCVIGDNVVIYPGVTLAARRVGNHVQIFSGAVIANRAKIGNNVRIGANAVVLTDVPDNSSAFGVPAKIISGENMLSVKADIYEY